VRAALAFLTPLPLGGPPPDRGTLAWFPVAGALIGAVVGVTWWGASEVLPVAVAAALAVTVDLVVTGGLHVDGLADSADGLLPHHEGPGRRLAVMRQPDVGAFGAAAVGAALLLRWSALASAEPDVGLVAAVWAGSRALMALALLVVPYVGGGLGAAFLGARRPAVLASAAVAVGVPTALAVEPVAALAAVVAALLAGCGVVALGRARLGGITGDVAGAAGVVAETIGLVVATARW
jgi:adenosylcobinamide-GDP ribazoletransferase